MYIMMFHGIVPIMFILLLHQIVVVVADEVDNNYFRCNQLNIQCFARAPVADSVGYETFLRGNV